MYVFLYSVCCFFFFVFLWFFNWIFWFLSVMIFCAIVFSWLSEGGCGLFLSFFFEWELFDRYLYFASL